MSREDRPGSPHVRIPDEFYKLLGFFAPREVTLLLAILCQTWRKEGRRKGEVRKSLRRIARDIRMSWAVAQRACQALRDKGFVSIRNGKLYVDCDPFATALATAFATFPDRGNPVEKTLKNWPAVGPGGPLEGQSGPLEGQEWPAGGPPTALNGNGHNGFTHGRSDLGIRGIRRASTRDARATVPLTEGQSDRPSLTRSLGSLATGSEGLTIDNSGNGGDTVTDDELTVRQMDRKEAMDLIARVKQHALEEAEKGGEEWKKNERERRERLHEEQREKRRREIERRALLEKQRELLAEEQEGELS